ncbi:rRNA methyltransferase [Vandammella animalimorsus]|uniref:rRNA methyltransferase n=1 Tax=Vandammella animalimorsus TaxID=2029117 RepID=A0A2A2AF47_9BURK|nr:rRNA methyltransferase [Vandammella animalimorsus]
MSPPSVTPIASRENAQVKLWRRLAQQSNAYRKHGQLWLEGEHLCAMAQQARLPVQALVLSRTRWEGGELAQWLPPQGGGAPSCGQARVFVLEDGLFAHVSGLESPAGLAYVAAWQAQTRPVPGLAAVVLDRLQDAGNVGAILRCAAAFGFGQVLALEGTVALHSPKVLRAGMGAHFSLHLLEQATLEQVQALQLPLLLTSSHAGQYVHQARLPWPCAWVLGHEGQGVAQALAELPHQPLRIAQPGGQESLNVAAAAAICLHASAVSALDPRPHGRAGTLEL